MFSFLLLLLSAQFSLVFINILFICLSFFVVWANQLDQHAIVIKLQCGQFWLSQAAFSFVQNFCHLFLWCKVMRIYFHCFNEWPHSINSLAPFESAYLLASITLIIVGLNCSGIERAVSVNYVILSTAKEEIERAFKHFIWSKWT